MRTVNLLAPIPSIRNTLRPDGSHASRPKRRFMAVAAIALCAVAAGYGVSFYLDTDGAHAPMKVGAPAASAPETTPPTAPQPSTPVEPLPALVEAPPAPEENTAATSLVYGPPVPPFQGPPAPDVKTDEVAPDEVKQVAETAKEFDPLLSRPVAQDAEPLAKPKGVEAPPPSGKWTLRFGLCVYKPNCDKMIEDLASKKIDAFISEGAAEVTFYKVMVGPYPTQTHAEEAAKKFHEKNLELAPFAVEDQYYLGAASFIDPKTQNEIIEFARSLDYKAEGMSGKETRKVYKVYRRRLFDTKKDAEKAMMYHKERGLACVIERQE